MQFIKKHYEKVLLGLVLVGLVAVAVFMLIIVGNERQLQEERRTKIINRPIKPLAAVELAAAEALLKRAQAPAGLNLSDNAHKLFNPVRWQRSADGRLIKNPVGTDLARLEITDIKPLYLNISLDSVSVSDSGARYVILVEQQAAARPNQRGKRSYYVSVGEKREFGDRKDTFILRSVQGPPENPTELVLELSDSDKLISISKDKPFQRVDGYSADLRYPPENRTFNNRRVGDRVFVAGEEYNVVAITANEVVLSARSNQKKWTITYSSAAP
jgi:hypothetical protein